MKKYKIASALLALTAIQAAGKTQMPDTTGIYAGRADSLEATVFTGSADGNFLSKGKDIRTEVISAAGLCKMACCNLAESFENSASVTVGYSDAVTGARQIRLLGQSGIYTQMLDENRPVMRGISAPWGLNFIPSQWLQSIQIAKGVTSVINGVESMTGQINMEHRKPTDEKPLFIQASYMNDTKADINMVSSLQLDEEQRWSTVIFAHADANFKPMDHNSDGFMDDPRQKNFSVGNRWLYMSPTGAQLRFGARAICDDRTGGEMDEKGWRSDIGNKSLNGYLKFGIPVSEDGEQNIAIVTDYTYQMLDGAFGQRQYDATQHSAFANLMYQNHSNESHHFTLGASTMLDCYDEDVLGSDEVTRIADIGLYGEYTLRKGKEFSAIAGLREDWFSGEGLRFTPRLTLKWAPVEEWVFRANAGRGLRFSTPLIDNIGVMSTGKSISGAYLDHILEDSWTWGANATWYLPVDESGKTYLSLDFFHTSFSEQMLLANDASGISFYQLSSEDGATSRTSNLQADFSTSPARGLSVTITGRLTDARQTLRVQSDDIKPMTSRYKGVLNVQYATNLNKWIFDFTASLNGPCRVWDFMKEMYPDGYSPAYPLLYAQVTRRFRGFDIYAGGENLTGFTQKNPIIGADNPFSSSFDASCVWGPLMGARIYAGIRMTIWKKG